MHLHVQAKGELGSKRLQGGDVVALTGLSKVGELGTIDNADATCVIVRNATMIVELSVDIIDRWCF